MWYAALPELLVFLFAVGSFLFWIAWMQASRGREIYYAAALLCYVLALLSKESGVVVGPLLLLAAWAERRPWRESLLRVVPFCALAIFNFAMIYGARGNHLHFNDGTFSIHGPFWVVVPVSVGRLLWVWGLFSLLALACWRERRWIRLLWIAAVWMVVTLLPYSFLTYMPRVPSRHTYFASVGLALIVAAGILTFRERFQTRPWAVGVLATILVAHQCLYIWIKKQGQFEARAAPTERLLQLASNHHGPLYVECFPFDSSLAKLVVKMYYGDRVRLIFDATEAEALNLTKINLCTAPEPRDPKPAASAGTRATPSQSRLPFPSQAWSRTATHF
jgi:hypothetical protein